MASAALKKKWEKAYAAVVAEAEQLDHLDIAKQQVVEDMEVLLTPPPGSVNTIQLAEHLGLTRNLIDMRLRRREKEIESFRCIGIRSDGSQNQMKYYRIPGTTTIDWDGFSKLVKIRPTNTSKLIPFPIKEFTCSEYAEQDNIGYRAARSRITNGLNEKNIEVVRREKRGNGQGAPTAVYKIRQ